EVGTDTNSFNRALRSAMRENPDIIFIGEMRDFETVDAALTLAETGHLVFSTLHTNNAAQSADRMIDMFPPYLQEPARKQLAAVLLGILSQRLVPKVGGGRIAAAEILIATSAVRSLIREGKAHQLDNIIATSAADGMISLDKVLAELVSHG
ncbi:Flp pilus assembly complex ATPase component, partial [Candidatus Berkelbacteria bacterium]|nr:Flp pilus assembly complex ATPase component [Candidatus Berkelbacteria bacterium]